MELTTLSDESQKRSHAYLAKHSAHDRKPKVPIKLTVEKGSMKAAKVLKKCPTPVSFNSSYKANEFLGCLSLLNFGFQAITEGWEASRFRDSPVP